MAKGSKIGSKRNTRNKVHLKKKGSDESDEDYMASEDEVFELSEDEYCSSLADDESESEEEEEEWFKKKPKKARTTRGQKGFPGRKKNGAMRPRRKVVSYNEEEEDYEDDGFIAVKKSTKNVSSHKGSDDDEDLFEPEEEEEDNEDDGLVTVKESTKKLSSRKWKDDDDDDDDDDLFEPEEGEEDYGDDSLTSVKESKKNVSSRKRKNGDDDEFEPEQEEEEEEEDYEDDGVVSVKENKKKLSSRKRKNDDDDDEFEPEQEEEEDYEDDGLVSVKENKKNVSSRKGKDDDDDDLFEPEEEDEEEEYEDDGLTSVKESKKNVSSRKEKEDDEDLFEPAEDDEEDNEDDGFMAVKGNKKSVISHKVEEADDYEDFSEQEKDEEEDYEDDDFIPVKESKKNVISRQVKEYDDNEDLFKPEEDEEEDDDFVTFQESEKITTSREMKENYENLFEQEDDDFFDRKSKISRYGNGCQDKPRKKNRVSYREAGEDSDSDDSNDEEFTPEGLDGLDDEREETPVTKSRSSRPRMVVTRITKGRRTKRARKVMNRTKRNNTASEQLLSKKRKSVHDNELSNEKYLSWKKTKTTKQGTRKKKFTLNSDSDFVSSGPSDHDFTISEEEREQVREASEFCRRPRRSDQLDMVIEKETVVPERKRPIRKGKEKMQEMKIEVAKQVCGICLSEEGKRTVRGILNSCSHYFCFACIMEWSKVESRCPLCKQRFATITRTSRADGGLDSRDAVIAVPERDQVYQPSEEELRGYLDPYESVLCTECQHGGDDAHMLLCDLCDSPAHTYCVGLGHEVPDGNWYCDGCRPTILASQAQSHIATDYRASNNSFANSSPPVARQTFDLNEMYVPDTPLTQVSEPSPLFRNANGDAFATSPTYGSGAFTLFERRRIQRQIHQFLNDRSRRSERSSVRDPQTAFASNEIAAVSSTTLFGSQLVSVAPQNGVVPVSVAPERIFDHGRVSNYGTPLMYSREGIISPRFGSWRGQMPHDQGSTSMSHGFVGLPQTQFGGIGVAGGGVHHQLQPCIGRSNTGVAASISPFQFQEATLPSRTLQRSLHPPFN